MDKETLSNYGWIVICVLILAVMLALATPFGSFVSKAVWNTAQGLFDTNSNALEAGINGILGKEKIEVDGLGEITVQNPYGAEFEYDEETGILTGKTPITPIEPEDLTNVIPMIEFTAGTFESNTEYTPGQYELESYEVTKTRAKKPVACNGGIIISCTYVGEGTFKDNQPTPDYVDQASTYIAYCVARAGDTSVNGFVPFHLNYRTIANTADDTLENAIYIAAYTQKGTNINWNVAKWDGSKYVDVNCRADIDAITDFTEAYTETVSKPVAITKPSNSTSLVYVPSGTMKAEAGMTWNEWLASEYNTLGAETTTVWDSDYNEVALDSEIVASGKYGFTIIDGSNNSPWPISWNSMEVSENKKVTIGDLPFVKVSEYTPSIGELLNTELSAMGEYIQCADAQTIGNITVALYGEMPAILVVNSTGTVDELGVTFTEIGTYALDFAVEGLDTDIKLTLLNPMLNTPQISISNKTLIITPVENASKYEVYVNDTLITTTSNKTIDLSSKLGSDCAVYVRAIGNQDYRASNFVCCTYTTTMPEPGLYEPGSVSLYETGGKNSISGKMIMSWNELVANGVVDRFGRFLQEDYLPQEGDLIIPNGFKSISEEYYYGIDNLKGVFIPDSVTSIDKNAFAWCENLTTIVFSENNQLKTIGERAFLITSLSTISIPESVTSIGESAFHGTRIKSIYIPSNVTNIGISPFADCELLTSITVSNDNKVYHSAGNCLIETSTKTLIQGCRRSNIPSDGSVLHIGESAFESIFGINETVKFTIPNTIVSIGYRAFAHCSYMKTITIPESVKRIDAYAFTASNLTSVSFQNPNGWWCASTSDAVSGTELSSTDLSKPSTAATYIKNTYYTKYWFCSQ